LNICMFEKVTFVDDLTTSNLFIRRVWGSAAVSGAREERPRSARPNTQFRQDPFGYFNLERTKIGRRGPLAIRTILAGPINVSNRRTHRLLLHSLGKRVRGADTSLTDDCSWLAHHTKKSVKVESLAKGVWAIYCPKMLPGKQSLPSLCMRT